MNPTRRKRYLKALGVEAWVERGAAVAEAGEFADAPVNAPVLAAQAAAVPALVPPVVSETPTTKAMRSVPSPAAPVVAAAPKPVVEVPRDWEGLRAMVKDCRLCKLCSTRTQTVFGVGLEDAPLLVIGEGPGADEDARGEPFVGRAGQLLDQMLLAIGRSRQTNTYIANVVKCRPPGNRDPEPDEVEACRPYLDRQIELIQPKLIVGLGRTAAQRLLHTDEPLSRLRGPLHHYGAGKMPVMITYHPAYLLRSPREKAKSWEDLKRIHRLLTAPA